jgi:carbonic anhydrase
MSGIDRFLDHASRYAEGFDKGGLSARPASRAAVVCCMDSRINLFTLLGLAEGEAHVIRNAGGIVTDDVERSLCLSQRALGTEEVLLLHHTNCGLLGVDDDTFADELEADTGVRPPWRVGGFTDVEADVRQSMERLRSSPFLANTKVIRGFVYDVDTGKLNEVLPG